MARQADRGNLPGGPLGGTSRTLEYAMLEPNTTPDVVVVDAIDEAAPFKEVADPTKDLWLSTADGRYNSLMIDIRVGPHAEIFPVHKAILTKSDFFSKALNGEFMESKSQTIDLPEEDPTIFSFLVAFLYEGTFVPIKPLATVLVSNPDKGKGRESDRGLAPPIDAASDSSGSNSDDGARNRRRTEQHRRRNEVAFQQVQFKDGHHRAECRCAICVVASRSCWNCGRPQAPPIPRQPVNYGPQIIQQFHYAHHQALPGPPQPYPPGRRLPHNMPVAVEPPIEANMDYEDLSTWSLMYSLSIKVYVCAERYCLSDFKSCIAAYVVNSFEIIGMEAALPTVLQSCKILHDGVSSMDPFLKKVFARVGFLQARLWKNWPETTQEFFMKNPDLALLIMKEMIERREHESLEILPAMDRPLPIVPMSMEQMRQQGHPMRRPLPYDHELVDD